MLFLPIGDDNTSSVCDVTFIPDGEKRLRFLGDCSEGEKTGDNASPVSCPIFFGAIPVYSESVTDWGQDSPQYSLAWLSGHSTASSRPKDDRRR